MKKIISIAIALTIAITVVLLTAVPALACDSRWTGGGSVFTSDGQRVTHGFEFHNCKAKPNNLQVNWGGNHFHLTELLTASCWMNTNFPPPDPPKSPTNYVEATGVGRYNGIDGYSIRFKFSDVGEPGISDHVEYLVITAPGGEVVLDVGNDTLTHGNHQSHPCNK